MKDVNCKNWSSKFSFGRRGSQQFCSVGTEMTEASFQFRFNPRRVPPPTHTHLFPKGAQEQGGVGRERGTGEQNLEPAILVK